MKKFYSFVAAMMVALTVIVSCGSKSAYQAEFDAAKTAYDAQDYSTVITRMQNVFKGDKAEAFDLLLAVSQTIAATQAQAQAGQAVDVNINYDILEALNKAKGMKDADVANTAVKALTDGDMLSLIPQFEAAVAQLDAAAEAANAETADAEDAEAEGDAEEAEVEAE
ncbi:MAG: hypothetical protein MJZ61_08845 [Bacteroidales bacterium]|nr:hypothetical protein [Bacteroidales bacterium]